MMLNGYATRFKKDIKLYFYDGARELQNVLGWAVCRVTRTHGSLRGYHREMYSISSRWIDSEWFNILW
jgi:hypothetical protein